MSANTLTRASQRSLPILTRLASLASLAAVACGGATTGGELVMSEQRIELTTAEFTIAPGAEQQLCYYTSLPYDHDVMVRGFDAVQGSGGHHIVLFKSLTSKPDGTLEDCSSAEDMLDFTPLLITSELNHMSLPDELAVRIPARTQIVIQMHYLNATPNPATVRDTVKLRLAEPGAPVQEVGFWTTAGLSFAIPPMAEHTLSYRCVADKPMQLLSLVGHMHEHGSRMSIGLGSPGNVRTIHAVDEWEPSFRNEAPQLTWSMDAPLQVNAGDVMEVSCTWRSKSTEELRFPAEMCTSTAAFFPADGSITCIGDSSN